MPIWPAEMLLSSIDGFVVTNCRSPQLRSRNVGPSTAQGYIGHIYPKSRERVAPLARLLAQQLALCKMLPDSGALVRGYFLRARGAVDKECPNTVLVTYRHGFESRLRTRNFSYTNRGGR